MKSSLFLLTDGDVNMFNWAIIWCNSNVILGDTDYCKMIVDYNACCLGRGDWIMLETCCSYSEGLLTVVSEQWPVGLIISSCQHCVWRAQ